MSLKLIASVLSWVISFMPDSMKTVLCKVLGLLSITVAIFIVGFYFGWEQKTADVLEEQVALNQKINQLMRQQTADAVQQSNVIASQIQQEQQLAYERKQEQQKLSEKGGVLELPLPDDVIRLLNSASSPTAVGSAR